jgi:hypothetical protein
MKITWGTKSFKLSSNVHLRCTRWRSSSFLMVKCHQFLVGTDNSILLESLCSELPQRFSSKNNSKCLLEIVGNSLFILQTESSSFTWNLIFCERKRLIQCFPYEHCNSLGVCTGIHVSRFYILYIARVNQWKNTCRNPINWNLEEIGILKTNLAHASNSTFLVSRIKTD